MPDSPLPPPAAPCRLRTVSWNIHSCVGTDSRFSPGRVAGVLKAAEADIIGLQEIGWHHRGEPDVDQFAYMAEATGLRAVPALIKDHAGGHYGLAVLTKLPVLETRPLDLRVGRREPRIALLSVLEAPYGPLRVVVAHLGLDPWERRRQAQALVQALADPMPTILMGDLNEFASGSAMVRILHAALPRHAAPRSFPSAMPTLRLDRFFASRELRLEHPQAIRTPVTKVASDHLPIMTELVWDEALATAPPQRGATISSQAEISAGTAASVRMS